MKRVEVPSYPVSIFMAGSLEGAREVCYRLFDRLPMCVTVTPTQYVYVGGAEDGFIVGLINYPRFPSSRDEIWSKAERVAAVLCSSLCQQSYTIQAPDRTVFFSHRSEDNLASVDRNPEGQDPQGLGAEHESAAPKADAQPSTPEIEAEISRLQVGGL